MDFVSVLISLFSSLVSLSFFHAFIGAFTVVSLFSMSMHFVSGMRVLYF